MTEVFSVEICAFLQARMSSRRFPGKVLAPFRGKPLVAHVVERVRAGLGVDRVVLITSEHPTDDPLAAYGTTLGVPVFRGPLDDVLGRFQAAVASHPTALIMRICCDSPLIEPSIVRRVADVACAGSYDVVTTTRPRTFPRGHNVEVIRRKTLLGVDPAELEPEDREHVTRFFYRHLERFSIHNVESGDPALAQRNDCVDTPEDLARLDRVEAA